MDEGSIIIDNTDVTNVTEHKRAAVLGRVFQDLCLEQQRIWALKKTLHWRLDADRGGG